MFLVGLTGSIATGKSTVSKIFKDCGCTFIDADLIARNIMEPGKPAYRDVIRIFGPDIKNSDNTIDRTKLGDIIFRNNDLREELNKITHRRIGKEILVQIFKYFLYGKRFVILDVPLLIENGFWLKYIKHCIVVYCEPSLQLERLQKRNNYTREDALNRINSQMPVRDKVRYATYVIDNNGTIENTEKQVIEICSLLKKQWSLTFYECGLLFFFALGLPIWFKFKTY